MYFSHIHPEVYHRTPAFSMNSFKCLPKFLPLLFFNGPQSPINAEQPTRDYTLDGTWTLPPSATINCQ